MTPNQMTNHNRNLCQTIQNIIKDMKFDPNFFKLVIQDNILSDQCEKIIIEIKQKSQNSIKLYNNIDNLIQELSDIKEKVSQIENKQFQDIKEQFPDVNIPLDHFPCTELLLALKNFKDNYEK